MIKEDFPDLRQEMNDFFEAGDWKQVGWENEPKEGQNQERNGMGTKDAWNNCKYLYDPYRKRDWQYI